MNQELINRIMHQMSDCLDNRQMLKLKQVLDDIVEKNESDVEDSEELLERFLATKKMEGRSEKTLKNYRMINLKMIKAVDKNVRAITTDDLRKYLSDYQNKGSVCNRTVENMRLILSSFFNWLEDENYILKSPVKRIHKIKTTIVVKEAYSADDMEKIRHGCSEIRDKALVDLLSSTGMRIGELVQLNRSDLNFSERECIVHGKGDKERIVYFDARAKLHLELYLESRSDQNEALFVGLRFPFNRISINGIELRLRQLGNRIGVKKCHPHRFRRTMATMAIDKGMPIEQVQKLLGHEKIDTTLQYAMVKQSNVKNSHRKYIG